MIYAKKTHKNSTHFCWEGFELIEYIKKAKLDPETKEWAFKKNTSRRKEYHLKSKFDFFLTILIYSQCIPRKEHPRYNKEDLYFGIHKKHLEKWLGSGDYPKYRDLFIKIGILDINPKYKNSLDGKGFTKSYRLTQKFRKKINNKELVIIRQRPDTKDVQKRVRKPARRLKKDPKKPLSPLGDFLKQNFLDLQFDMEQFNKQKDPVKNVIFSTYEKPLVKWASMFCQTNAIADNDNQLPYDSYIEPVRCGLCPCGQRLE